MSKLNRLDTAAEPVSTGSDPRLGPEPVGGWHRGIPGLRKRTPAAGEQPTAFRYLPVWTAEDCDEGEEFVPMSTEEYVQIQVDRHRARAQ